MFLLFTLFTLVSIVRGNICDSVNAVRMRNGKSPLRESSLLNTIATVHLQNLISNNYDPFAGGTYRRRSVLGSFVRLRRDDEARLPL